MLTHKSAGNAARILSGPIPLIGALLWGLLSAAATAAEPPHSARRCIPSEGLIAYIEFDGLGAHANAWKATAVSDMLDKTPAGDMIRRLAGQWISWLLKKDEDLGAKISAADFLAIHDHIIRNGFVFAVFRTGNDELACMLVLNAMGKKEIRRHAERLGRLMTCSEKEPDGPKPARVRGRDVYKTAAEPAELSETWLEGDDLVAVTPDRRAIDSVLDVIEGKRSNVSSHPGLAAALAEAQEIKGFESIGLFIIDSGTTHGLVTALLDLDDERPEVPSGDLARRDQEVSRAAASGTMPLPDVFGPDELKRLLTRASKEPADVQGKPEPFGPTAAADIKKGLDAARAGFEALGLDGVKRIVGRFGFQGRALLSDARIEAPAPRKGFLTLLDQPAFRKDHLSLIPSAATSFCISSFDPDGSFVKLKDMAGVWVPEIGDEIAAGEQLIQTATGLRLREDLLRHLGPTWSVVSFPTSDTANENRPEWDPLGCALVTDLSDADKFGKILDGIASGADKLLRDLEADNAGEDEDRQDAGARMVALERLPAPDRGYRLTSPAGLVYWIDEKVKPVILLGKSSVVIAANLDQAHKVVAAEAEPGARWKPTAELVEAFGCLPEHLTFLAVGDHRRSPIPGLIAHLPASVQLINNLLDPGAELGDDDMIQSGLRMILGIPQPGGFRVRIDPKKVPKEEALRALLFPSVLAATMDERGMRLIAREACPCAFLPGGLTDAAEAFDWNPAKGLIPDLKLNPGTDTPELGVDIP
jgi:hypothetical protein